MSNNPVRQALLQRKPTFGSWIQVGHPVVAEVLASVDFSWLAVDCEHTDIDVAGFSAVARGMHGRGVVPMVRVRENDTLAIRQMLDAGAMGGIVPLVNTAEDAARAVAAAKYPPQGVRGFCFSRMNDWGASFEQYVTSANDDIAVVVMIESVEAVGNISEILDVEGVDGVLVGPYDLSGSLGIPGQTSHPKVKEACQSVVAACRNAGKAAGLHIVTPTAGAVHDALSDGMTFLALGVDTVFVAEGAERALDIARQVDSGDAKNT